jgi:predicted NAD/FAD-binding protein
MPRSRGAWASWNYRTHDCTAPDPRVTVTYDISRLQGLAGPERYLVSLNRADIAPDLVMERIDYAHPLFTFDALRAQREIHTISGVRRTWYCGAWTGYGFHEDGFRSGLRVAEALGSGWT